MDFYESLLLIPKTIFLKKSDHLKMIIGNALYASAFVAASIACSTTLMSFADAEDAPPFTVMKRQEQVEGMSEYHGYPGQGYWTPTYSAAEFLSITSKIDSLTIQKITANRGNCAVLPLQPLPATLKFGEVLKVRLGCNPLEVVTDTSEGSNTSSWDQ